MKNNNIFKWFLYSTAIIDLINGFVIDEIGVLPISLGQIYRIMFILFAGILIVKYSNKQEKMFFSIITYYFIISALVRFYLNNNIKLVFDDIINLSKLLLIIMIIISGKILIRKKEIKKRDLQKIIEFNGYVVIVTLIICKIFNLGNYAYLDGVGFKGYFYSNNEVSIVLSLIFIYKWEEIYKQIINKNRVKFSNFFILLLIISSAVIIGAKTVYLVFVITLILSICRVLIKMDIYSLLKFIFALGIVAIIFSIIGSLYNEEINAIIIKQKYHFENRSLLSFILSDRDILWKQLKDTFISGRETIIKVLLGFTPSFYNVELDLHALYINYGIIGVSLIIIPTIKLLLSSKKKYIIIYPFIIYISFSLTAGHVMFGAFAGTFFSIHCLSMIEDKINTNINESV